MMFHFAVLYYHKNFWYKKFAVANDEFASAKGTIFIDYTMISYASI